MSSSYEGTAIHQTVTPRPAATASTVCLGLVVRLFVFPFYPPATRMVPGPLYLPGNARSRFLPLLHRPACTSFAYCFDQTHLPLSPTIYLPLLLNTNIGYRSASSQRRTVSHLTTHRQNKQTKRHHEALPDPHGPRPRRLRPRPGLRKYRFSSGGIMCS